MTCEPRWTITPQGGKGLRRDCNCLYFYSYKENYRSPQVLKVCSCRYMLGVVVPQLMKGKGKTEKGIGECLYLHYIPKGAQFIFSSWSPV